MTRLSKLGRSSVRLSIMKAAVEAIGKLPDTDRDFTGRSLAIIRLLDELRVPDKDRAEIAMSIMNRMEALARLHTEKAYRAWSMASNTPGMEFIHSDLVEAAASEPLIIGDRDAHFDPTSFFNRVLEQSDLRGKA